MAKPTPPTTPPRQVQFQEGGLELRAICRAIEQTEGGENAWRARTAATGDGAKPCRRRIPGDAAGRYPQRAAPVFVVRPQAGGGGKDDLTPCLAPCLPSRVGPDARPHPAKKRRLGGRLGVRRQDEAAATCRNEPAKSRRSTERQIGGAPDQRFTCHQCSGDELPFRRRSQNCRRQPVRGQEAACAARFRCRPQWRQRIVVASAGANRSTPVDADIVGGISVSGRYNQ